MRVPLPSNQQAPEVSQPGDCPLYRPSALVPTQLPTVLSLGLDTTTTMRTDQIDPSFGQALTQRIRVRRSIVDQWLWVRRIAVLWRHWHGSLFQGLFDQRDLRRGRRGGENSQRKTLAVCHHHKLRTLSL